MSNSSSDFDCMMPTNTLEFTLLCYRSFNQPRTPAPKAAPTFEDLTIDDNLSEQQRVIRYTKSTIGLQRYSLPIESF
jgi:hypothetical protein